MFKLMKNDLLGMRNRPPEQTLFIKTYFFFNKKSLLFPSIVYQGSKLIATYLSK
jgi:hypothetical protein